MNLRQNKKAEDIPDIHPITIGKNYIFKIVGDVVVGKVKNINPQWITLSTPSSIGDYNLIKFINENKEPDFKYETDVYINVDSIINIFPYNKSLPK